MTLHLFFVAGEPSGDLLGAKLMRAVRSRHPDAVFSGVGGAQMKAQGLTSLFPMEDLSVMGLAEVVPRIPQLLARIRQTADRVCELKPAALITIDSPDFSFRVSQRVKKTQPSVLRIHCVAPSVWAWRPGRAKKVSGFLDHLLALLPFEPPYFEKEGLSCDYIGHPLLEAGASQADGAAFRQKHGILPTRKLLCVLPGSRVGEITRHAPVFFETVNILKQIFPDLAVVIPTLPHLAELVRTMAGPDTLIVDGIDEKYAAFAASDAALAASGTVTLELAFAALPSVIAYKVNALTACLGRLLIRIPHAGLSNIILGRGAVPEFIQENCVPEKLAPAVQALLENPAAAAAQKKDLAEVVKALAVPGAGTPAEHAASAILGCIQRRQGNAQAG